MAVRHMFILCEGQTEEAFVELVLAPHFREVLGVYAEALLLPSTIRAKSRSRKGGWSSYGVARGVLLNQMKLHHREDIWFTTMLDLYALPPDFPGSREASGSGVERVRALEAAFAKDVVTDTLWRFTPHLQLHEFEALLLVDVDVIGQNLTRGGLSGVSALKVDVKGRAPESVDHHPETAPSKLIIRHFPSYEGLKATAGPLIAADIGLPRLRAACPHFDGWLDELERRCRE